MLCPSEVFWSSQKRQRFLDNLILGILSLDPWLFIVSFFGVRFVDYWMGCYDSIGGKSHIPYQPGNRFESLSYTWLCISPISLNFLDWYMASHKYDHCHGKIRSSNKRWSARVYQVDHYYAFHPSNRSWLSVLLSRTPKNDKECWFIIIGRLRVNLDASQKGVIKRVFIHFPFLFLDWDSNSPWLMYSWPQPGEQLLETSTLLEALSRTRVARLVQHHISYLSAYVWISGSSSHRSKFFSHGQGFSSFQSRLLLQWLGSLKDSNSLDWQ